MMAASFVLPHTAKLYPVRVGAVLEDLDIADFGLSALFTHDRFDVVQVNWMLR